MNEHQEHLEKLVKEVRTAYRAKRSMQKVKPQALVGNDRTLTELLFYYCGQEPNWREQVWLQILEEEDDTQVRVLRSVDMSYGEVVVL